MSAGGFAIENDLSRAKFDVTASVGPATSSKRQAVRKELLTLAAIAKDPQTASIIEQQLMMNLEGEGMSEMRDFFRKKLVRLGVDGLITDRPDLARKLLEERKIRWR